MACLGCNNFDDVERAGESERGHEGRSEVDYTRNKA